MEMRRPCFCVNKMLRNRMHLGGYWEYVYLLSITKTSCPRQLIYKEKKLIYLIIYVFELEPSWYHVSGSNECSQLKPGKERQTERRGRGGGAHAGVLFSFREHILNCIRFFTRSFISQYSPVLLHLDQVWPWMLWGVVIVFTEGV